MAQGIQGLEELARDLVGNRGAAVLENDGEVTRRLLIQCSESFI